MTSIVVPTRNEAKTLVYTVPALLKAAETISAKIVWVCNGCSDDSASIIRRLTGCENSVIEIETAGKTAALNAGDRVMKDLFPRFYIDADALVDEHTLQALLVPLENEQADMVSPRQVFDTDKSSKRSARIAHCWMSLPHARETAFAVVIGLSKQGRSYWDKFPPVSGDDIFMSAKIPPARRMLVPDETVRIPAPGKTMDWVRTRARWLKGEREIQRIGLSIPRSNNQRSALRHQLTQSRTRLGAVEFILVRVLANFYRIDPREPAWIPSRNHLEAQK